MYQLSYSTHTRRLFVIRYGGDHMYVTSILHVLVVNNLNNQVSNECQNLCIVKKSKPFPLL